MHVGHRGGPELGFPKARGEPVEHPGGHEAVPAQGSGVDVSDGPVGVMGEGVDRADGEQRPLEGGHAVEGDGDGEELDDGIGAELVPCAAEGEEAVEHARPGGCPEHQREEHPEHLQPVGQGGVEQVVGAGPDVDEDERPEVDDGEPVGIHRAIRRLRDEIIHDPEDWRSEEEGDGVVAIPPLDQRVLDTAEDGVGVGERGGDGKVVYDVEHRDGDDRRDVEPQ